MGSSLRWRSVARPSGLLTGTLALFVVSLGYGVIVPLLPDLAGGRAVADEALLSAVYAGYGVAKIALQVPAGVLVDRVGAERVLRLALLFFAVSLAGFLLPVGLGWFTLIRAVEGAATGLVYPACFSLAARGGDGVGRRMGVMGGIGTSGLLVGPALGGLLSPYGVRVPVAVALGAALIVLVLAMRRAGSSSAIAAASKRTLRGELGGLSRLCADLAFIGLILPITFNKLTFSAFQGLLPLVGPDHLEIGTRGVTGLFVLTGLVFAGSQPIGGLVADRFNARSVTLWLTLPLLGSLAAMASQTHVVGFAVTYGAYIASSSFIFTASMKHAAQAFGSDGTYGGVFGVLGTLTDLATVAGPLLFLNLYPVAGLGVFAVMAAVGLPFVLGFLRLGRANWR